MSARGYRTDEPQRLKKRETSQILTKVFQGLRTKGVRPGDVTEQLGVTAEEMKKMHNRAHKQVRKILRGYRLKGDGVHHATLGIARVHNLTLAR